MLTEAESGSPGYWAEEPSDIIAVIVADQPMTFIIPRRGASLNSEGEPQAVRIKHKQCSEPVSFSEDYQEGLQAFADKRKPVWKGSEYAN